MIMNELSVEEKARRYDEAIIKARNIVSSINVGLIGKDSFEAVFPELAESNDERIRKEILEYFQQFDNKELCGVDISDWIVWLEQGEQKQEWSEEDEYHKRQILRILKDNGCSQTLQERTEKWIEERLKSLRPQSQWKPSDSQMASITCAVRKMKESACYDSGLVHLLQDLEKLRGD